MKKTVVISLIVASFSLANAANVTIQNINSASTGAYGLFDSSGVLLPDTLTANIRVGYFNISDVDVTNAWSSGDLNLLNSVFVDFGTAGMTNFGDGVVQDALSSSIGASSSFIGENVAVYVSNSNNFLDSAGEYLAFSFSQLFEEDDPNFDFTGILGETAGTLLFGSFGDFLNDFGLGSGPLNGFNTVAAVPEPSSFALIAGCFGLALAVVRRRSRCA